MQFDGFCTRFGFYRMPGGLRLFIYLKHRRALARSGLYLNVALPARAPLSFDQDVLRLHS